MIAHTYERPREKVSARGQKVQADDSTHHDELPRVPLGNTVMKQGQVLFLCFSLRSDDTSSKDTFGIMLDFDLVRS